MVTAILLGLIVVGIAGCSASNWTPPDPTDGGNEGDGDIEGEADAADAADAVDGGDQDLDGGVETDGDGGETTDPSIRAGFNGRFSDPTYAGMPCSVVDIDVNPSTRRMTIFCDTPINRRCQADLVEDDGLASPEMECEDDRVAATMSDPTGGTIADSEIRGLQIEEMNGGGFSVPLVASYSNPDGSTVAIGGVAYKAPDGLFRTTIFDTANPAIQSVHSGVMLDGRLRLVGTTGVDDGGEILSYGIRPNGAVDDLNPGAAISTTAQRPTAIAMVDDRIAAVLNTTGGPIVGGLTSFGGAVKAAVIDFVDLQDNSIVTSVNLPDAARPLPEGMVKTADGNYLAIALEQGGVAYVDLTSRRVYSLNERLGDIRGITAGSDSKVYVSTNQKVIEVDLLKSEKVPGDDVVIVVATFEDVGTDLGAIAYDSGIVYVTATTRWWEGAPTDETPLRSHIIAFDPEAAIPVIPSR